MLCVGGGVLCVGDSLWCYVSNNVVLFVCCANDGIFSYAAVFCVMKSFSSVLYM